MRISILAIIVIIIFPLSATAGKVTCSEDRNTRQWTCFDPQSVRSNGNLRATRLYLGGKNEIEKTPYTMVVNCKVGFVELRDRKGVVFGRDQPEKLHAVQLRDWICESKSIYDKTLD